MKFKTFRIFVTLGILAALTTGGIFLFRGCGGNAADKEASRSPSRSTPPRDDPPPRPEQPAPPQPAPTPTPAGDGAPARPMDQEILARAAQGIGGDKVKDALPGRSWKVNLYKDAGEARVNRAKVDLDRDDKWDEKWTFAEGKVTRQLASADDEAYDVTWTWTAGDWVKE